MEKHDKAEAAGEQLKDAGDLAILAKPSAVPKEEPAKKKAKKEDKAAPNVASVPAEAVAPLLKMIVDAESAGIKNITAAFGAVNPSVSKRQINLNIERMAVREKRLGDQRAMWYVRDQFLHLADEATKAKVAAHVAACAANVKASAGKENAAKMKRENKAAELQEESASQAAAAAAADGYDGSEEPKEAKKVSERGGWEGGGRGGGGKGREGGWEWRFPRTHAHTLFAQAFTHFCNTTRRSVKNSLSEEQRKDKTIVNGNLKQLWKALGDEDLAHWDKTEKDDAARYKVHVAMHEAWKTKKSAPAPAAPVAAPAASPPPVPMDIVPAADDAVESKKRALSESSTGVGGTLGGLPASPSASLGLIPKKKKLT
jgi:hypothetical protein